MEFDDVKTTVRDHPAETVAAVAVVGLIGTVAYCRWQNRKHQRELTHIELTHAREMIEFSRQERSKYKIHLAS